MKKEEQFDKLFEALTELDYGTWLRLKSSIDVEFDYLQSTNTLTEESVRRIYESLPSNRKESTMQEFKCKKCGNTKHAPQIWPKYCPMCGEKVEANHPHNEPISLPRNKDKSKHEQTVNVKFDSDKFMNLAKQCVKQCLNVTHH